MKLLVASLSALLLVAGGSAADQPRDSDVTSSGGQKQARNAITEDRAMATATDYIGQEVVNSSEQPLGEIVDLAVNGSQARVIYAVLASGGLLGIGQNLFAVPIGAFVNQAADGTLTLDISSVPLDEKDAFDADDWPTRANQSLGGAATTGMQPRPPPRSAPFPHPDPPPSGGRN